MARIDRRPRKRLDPDSRRAAILDAAAEAFASNSYADVTISMIAAEAGASNALVYRYFAGKEELYVALVRVRIADLLERQTSALGDLPEGTPARERIKVAIVHYLDHISGHPRAWAMPLRQPGSEPVAAATARLEARARYVERLRGLLEPSAQARHEYALWGWLGFIDAACLRWVDAQCPEDERWPLVDACLGALEGALGDWAA